MARRRSIHPRMFHDEQYVSVSDGARVLISFLGCFSDYQDRIENVPLTHKGLTGHDVVAELAELNSAGMVNASIVDGHIVGLVTFLFGHRRRAPSGWERLRQAVFERDGHRCQYCGASDTRLHADHIVPVSKGGRNLLENLLTACWFCNLSKGNRVAPRLRGSL